MVTIKEAAPVIDQAIIEAAALIEEVTGTTADPEWIAEQLADSEWIYGGCTDDEEDAIDLEEALLQLSYIVDRVVRFILDEQEATA